MKVAVAGAYPEPGAPIKGGVERVVDTLLSELGQRIDLTLIVPGANENREHTTRNVRTIYLKRAAGPGALRYWTADAVRLARCIDGIKPDLVHLHGAAGTGLHLKVPTIVTVHGFVDRDILCSERGAMFGLVARLGTAYALRHIERLARRRVRNLIVVNPYVVEVLPDTARLRQFHVPNPIDESFCRPRASYGNRREAQFVAVGQIGRLKNTLDIIEMASLVLQERTEATLMLCGAPADARYFQDCEELIARKGLKDRIELKGNLTTHELIGVLDGAACLIMASRQENSPMAIAEANARGVPAIAPEAFGIKYMIRPGRNGFFLPWQDIGRKLRC